MTQGFSAGQVGFGLVLNTGGYLIPADSTLTLIVSPGLLTGDPYPALNALRLTPVVAITGNLTALYLTTGDDFPAGGPGGPWTGWLEVQPPGGQLFYSAPDGFYVYSVPASS